MHSKEIKAVFKKAGVHMPRKYRQSIKYWDESESWCCGLHAVIGDDGCVYVNAYCRKGRGADKPIEKFEKNGSSSIVGHHSYDWDPDDD
jgi:hypothetical protein